jgi:predicted peptidase
MKTLSYVLICLMASIHVFAQSDANIFTKHSLNHESIELPYRLLKPEKLKAGKKYPLILFLHGAGERGNDNEANLMYITDLFLNKQNRKKYPAYVLVPQCPKDSWWINFDRQNPGTVLQQSEKPSTAMATVIALLDEIEKNESIDKSRIYVTGLSMGGFGTWDLITRYPDRFAAAAPICGGADTSSAAKIAHLPIWNFHGAKDAVVKVDWSHNMVEALQAANGNIKYTEYPEVNHDSWINAYAEPDFMKWMFSHTKRK